MIQWETMITFAPCLNKTELFSPIIAHALVTNLKTGIKWSTIITKFSVPLNFIITNFYCILCTDRYVLAFCNLFLSFIGFTGVNIYKWLLRSSSLFKCDSLFSVYKTSSIRLLEFVYSFIHHLL